MSESVEKTKTVLSKVVKTTPLAEKLLGRPPFRYLHDLIMEIQTITNYAADLYTSQERDAANVTDKEAKIAFLAKIIERLEKDTNRKISAKPAKIVAGLDPDDTNEFLQILGETATSINSNSSNTSSKPTAPPTVVKSNSKSSLAKSKSTSRSDELAPKPSEQQQQQSQQQKPAISSASESKPQTSPTKPSKPLEKKSSSLKPAGSQSNVSTPAAPTSPKKLATASRTKSTEKLSSASRDKLGTSRTNLNSSLRQISEGKQGSSQRLSTASLKPTPSSSALSPSKSKNDIPQLSTPETQKQPVTPIIELPLKPIDPPKPQPVEAPKPILESNAAENDSFFVMQQTPSIQVEKQADNILLNNSVLGQGDGSAKGPIGGNDIHGGLVRKIIETNKTLTTGPSTKQISANDANMEAIQSSKHKDHITLVGEMQSLRALVQEICRHAAPLNQLLDYFQEDLDAMAKELDQWKQEKVKYTSELESQRTETTKILAPLRTQLTNLDEQIIEKVAKIDETKAKIAENEEIIQRLVHNMVGTNASQLPATAAAVNR